MRTTIYLVRHAEAQSNISPAFIGEDNLTDLGLNQSMATADRFKNISIDKIYASDVLRAQLTAQEIAKVTGASVETKEYLKEGKATEDFISLEGRLAQAKELLEHSEDKHIIIVSHAVFLKSLASILLLDNVLTDELLAKMTDVFVVENASVSKFVFNKEKKKWRMMSWNDQVHLVN